MVLYYIHTNCVGEFQLLHTPAHTYLVGLFYLHPFYIGSSISLWF